MPCTTGFPEMPIMLSALYEVLQKYILSKFAIITKGAFLWDDPDQDQ